jgi:hypothetical protein
MRLFNGGPLLFMTLFKGSLLLLHLFWFMNPLSLSFSWVKMLRRRKNTTDV